jgi:hypothetical protein
MGEEVSATNHWYVTPPATPLWSPDSGPYGHTLPYPDAETGATSGHSGSATSKARAHAKDASGETQTLQEVALSLLANRQRYGATAREFGGILGIPHQSYSSVMSNLHKTGQATRLLEQRKGAEVYVLPKYADDRPVSEFRPNAAARRLASLMALVQKAEETGATAIYVTALRKVLS